MMLSIMHGHAVFESMLKERRDVENISSTDHMPLTQLQPVDTMGKGEHENRSKGSDITCPCSLLQCCN